MTTNITTKGEKSPGYVAGNYIDQSISISITKRLSILNSFRNLFESIKTPIKHYVDNPYVDFQMLSENYFSTQYIAGQQITVEGYLSKYLLTHRADFHIPYTQRAGETTIVEDSPTSGNVKMQILSEKTQLPIQSFPATDINGQKNFIYFLYQPQFNSFILKEDKNKKELHSKEPQECVLKITETHKPIIIISPIDLSQCSENLIKATGVLNKFSLEIAPIFSDKLTTTQFEILGNSFRPFNESGQSLCIDLLDKSKSRITVYSGHHKSVPATIYAETHFENTNNITDYEQYIGKLLPQAYPGLHWSSFNNPRVGEITCGLCKSDVSIITKGFTEFAYYIETDLKNERINTRKNIELREFIDTFRKNARRFYKKRTGIEIVNVYDFLYDYSKATVFHPKGVMSSKISKKIISENKEHQKTMKWIQTNNEAH